MRGQEFKKQANVQRKIMHTLAQEYYTLFEATNQRDIPASAIFAVVKQIVEKFEPDKIILFGSYAYGDPDAGSDVDLLVVMDTSLRNVEQAIQISRAIKYHFGLDLLVRRPRQLAQRIQQGDCFLREIVEKGKVLYERPGTGMD